MSEPRVGIYLIVEFEWPRPFSQEVAQNARKLHDLLQETEWITEVVAASGGLGDGPPSVWIFWLRNYAALDRLFHDHDDPVTHAYNAFFSQMPLVKDKIREQVDFG
ncbi:MAG: hypothetical protein H6654_05660 [Ardenticatenaceae bacterium]|nr:hypothetical protein [Anaerolineales bacterium]MCB8941913.1 hypothetical protein [Ardenticatenaceae bacterium]MCB8973027.1 hypothetical protein [Ardenticatenaceae bacterium]